MQNEILRYAKSLLEKEYPDYKTHSSLPPDILILCVSYNCEIMTGYDTYMYPYRYELYDSKKYGLYMTWYRVGHLMYRSMWRNGRRHGLYEAWYDRPNKQQKFCINYTNGLKRDAIAWDYDGQIIPKKMKIYNNF